MKKTIVVFLFLAAGLAVSAQNTSLGPTVGINGWTDANNNAQVGLNIGATFTYSVSAHWAFGADVKYSMEGGGKTISPKTADVKEDYIRVPLKILYFFGKHGQSFRPKLYVGPSFAFLVGGKINGSYNSLSYEADAKDYINGFDFGILMGTGFNYRLSKNGTWLNVDLGYTAGLTNVVKDNTSATALTSVPAFHNKSLAFNVGVAFPLGNIKTTTKSKRK